MDCSPPDSSVHGISQARILEWVTISFSRGSSQHRNQTCVSYIAGRFFTTVPPEKSYFHVTSMENKVWRLNSLLKVTNLGMMEWRLELKLSNSQACTYNFYHQNYNRSWTGRRKLPTLPHPHPVIPTSFGKARSGCLWVFISHPYVFTDLNIQIKHQWVKCFVETVQSHVPFVRGLGLQLTSPSPRQNHPKQKATTDLSLRLYIAGGVWGEDLANVFEQIFIKFLTDQVLY